VKVASSLFYYYYYYYYFRSNNLIGPSPLLLEHGAFPNIETCFAMLPPPPSSRRKTKHHEHSRSFSLAT